MEMAAQMTINALSLSALYVLVALGFALLLNVMNTLNFAHGAIYMVGGYICCELSDALGLNQWVSLAASALGVGLFGLFLEKYCFRPFYGDISRIVVMSVIIILVLETTANVTMGTDEKRIPSFVEGIIRAGGMSVTADRMVTILVSTLLVIGLSWFIRRSRLGQQMMAVAQEPKGATLQGISTNRVSAFACVLGCGLAAVAGSLMGAILVLSPFMGDYMLVKAIQLVILSGIGSLAGILVSGLIIGALDAVLPVVTSGAVTQTVGIGVIILLLLLRPRGLFGREV
ncbi:MAG: branched-chain amino acid ABC transporter permease [Syntrophorhabdales bacterium]|jgi:branched-subunit amino acid ABC-type transport system permease component